MHVRAVLQTRVRGLEAAGAEAAFGRTSFFRLPCLRARRGACCLSCKQAFRVHLPARGRVCLFPPHMLSVFL